MVILILRSIPRWTQVELAKAARVDRASISDYEQGIKAGDTRMLLSPDSEFFRFFTSPTGGVTPTPHAPAQR